MSAACCGANGLAYEYNQEFETIWRELYNGKDHDCPVMTAIHKTAWRRRPNYISLVDFEKALLGRMYQKLKTDFQNKRRAGMSAEKWRGEAGKLTRTADSAAGDEVRTLIEGGRSKCKPEVHQLPESVVDLDVLLQCDQALAAGDHELTPIRMSGDSGEPMWRVLRGELRTRDMLEHLRECQDCQVVLQLTNDQLLDFVVGASSRPINMRHISVIKKLGMRTGAIQFLIECRGCTGADQAARDRLDANLCLLGYRIPMQRTGRGSSRCRPPRLMQQRDKFVRIVFSTSTLSAWVRRDDAINAMAGWKRSRTPQAIIMFEPEETLSYWVALTAMISLHEKCLLLPPATRLHRTLAAFD